MKIKKCRVLALLTLLSLPHSVVAEEVTVSLTIPTIDVNPYHRPYVVVWIENIERKGVTTIAVWHEKKDWLKDMRQWWRRIGRSNKPAYDSASGATKKPGQYTLNWSPTLTGEYWLNIEAVREEGGREILRQKINLGSDQKQTYELKGESEIGAVKISIK